ncbi:MAG TPA: DNA methyltransferase [Allosphingosinicella sp.]|jgi:DNA modification methylase
MRYGPASEASAEPQSYLDFVRAKIIALPPLGFDVAPEDVHPALKPHNRDMVVWAVRGGRRAIFANFGLHKTIMQLEILRLIRGRIGGLQLQVAPLNVILEGTFAEDAGRIGVETKFVRTTAEVIALRDAGWVGQYLTNYESVREGKIDLSLFNGASLDEADCLRGFGGTKTFREFMRLFDGMAYKFVATATPSPNEYVELLAYCAFLEVMDVGQAKTRFFKRNSEEADNLTIHQHKVDEFWMWVNSWAAFVQRPSDLGHSDEGYDLPPLRVRWHEVPSDHLKAGEEADGQGLLLKREALGVVGASREKRDSIDARVAKLMQLRAEDPGAHRLIWHDLEAERLAIEKAIPGVRSVWGSQDLDARSEAFQAFKTGRAQELSTKPVIAGAGGNFQKHCHWAIFLGIGFKFRDIIQAIHRLQRYGQLFEVLIDFIFTEAERAVKAEFERKWRDHEAMCARMSEIIRTYGLGLTGASDLLERTVDEGAAERVEQGDGWTVYRNDTVIRTAKLESDSVGVIVTSIPFSTQYEYTPSYNDFGHSDDSAHFFRQMDYLTPELLRVLQPGRKLCVHVKDRVRPGGMEGVGFQTVDPFHAECIAHYRRHGFFYMGMITVETDVVRENNQTYRLGWTEKCKDGSRMSVGMPEYVLLFRKAPSDSSNGYADVPVVKAKADYPRARWQIDAHAKWRSSGDRLLAREDLAGLPARDIYRRFRAAVTASVYDHEWHVGLNQGLEDAKSLPSGFALLPPHAWHPDIWSDVARMRTLNGEQAAKGREMHLCPLQFDIVDRLIVSDSNPGEVVYDPFGGLMTVPLRAVKLGRRGLGVELNPDYFDDAVRILRDADRARATPSLFDLIAAEEASAEGEEDEIPEVMEAAE